jgi:hypothetical protein
MTKSIPQKSLVALLMRSPDIGQGWRNVSKMVMPLVTEFNDQTLIEWTKEDDGSGRVRLTEKGETVAPYL